MPAVLIIGKSLAPSPIAMVCESSRPFSAKPIVREQAPYQITEPDLYKVIEILDGVKK